MEEESNVIFYKRPLAVFLVNIMVWSIFGYSAMKLIHVFAKGYVAIEILIFSLIFSFFAVYHYIKTKRLIKYHFFLLAYLVLYGLIMIFNFTYNSIVFFGEQLFFTKLWIAIMVVSTFPISFFYWTGWGIIKLSKYGKKN
jgi:hypothetical protein